MTCPECETALAGRFCHRCGWDSRLAAAGRAASTSGERPPWKRCPRVQLSSLKGRPVVLNFWASWCTPCRKEMPDLQSVYDKYRAQGLEVYGVNVGESRVAVAGFQDRVAVRFPILLDPDETAQSAYKILPLPSTFLIGRDGALQAICQYQMSPGQIEAEVLRLLAR